ncbi:hypothetical protein FOA43_003265 [Brettanomyces nanus]|uniref:Uncharacterized protein n=1 Tax=Eeniella nana TaxID=13502 RepID=A0A875S857_EENNA|nr:uncharacterized protein FOA43_003265 [Brettanomyces nanus]QPG75879.1 hypothetical protein FOA43_003265 [Brettanomyces nanus]
MQSQGQIDPKLNESLPVEEVPKLEISYVTPNCAEAVVNLQMDYLLSRKSKLTKKMLGAKGIIAIIIGWASLVSYYRLGDYFSDYTFQNGFQNGLFKLLLNSSFRYNAVETISVVLLGMVTIWVNLFLQTNFLKEESVGVPERQKDYFGADMKEYSLLALNDKKKKLCSDKRKKVEFFKTNSVIIVYRSTPIAFAVKQVVQDNDDALIYRITGLGIRRVYIQAGVLTDLITCTIKNLPLVTSRTVKCYIDVYNFEGAEKHILKRLGFNLEKTQPTNHGFILDTLFGFRKETFVYTIAPNND